MSQAKLVTSVKKGKSVRHSAHQMTPKISFLLTIDFVSQAKLVTSVKKGNSVRHSAHRIPHKTSFLTTKDSVLAKN